jgi:hypothetical protein
MAGVTIFALFSWWFTPAEDWLPRQRISHYLESEGFQEGENTDEELVRDGETTPPKRNQTVPVI